MNNKDLIKQYVSTSGLSIPEHQFNQLNNNLKTSYLRKRIQAGETSRKLYLKDFEIIALPDDVRTNYIDKLSIDNLYDTLRYSNNSYRFYNEVLKNKKNFRMTDSDFTDLLVFANDSDGIAKIMIDVYNGNLSMEQIRKILICVLEPLQIKQLIEKKQPLVISDDLSKFDYLTTHTTNPSEVNKILIDYFKDKLTDEMIYLLLRNSKEPLYIDALIRKYRDYKIEDFFILRMIEYGKNPNQLKQLFKIG